MKKIICGSLISLAIFNIQAKEVKPEHYKVSYSELPRYSEVVDQREYVNLNSYQAERASTSDKWWMCGAAAFSTAINVLRSTTSKDVEQLEYFHTELSKYPRYASKTKNPHREAYGDDLADIINNRDDYTAGKITTTSRSRAKSNLHEQLSSSKKQQLIVLTQSTNGWGHFVVLHEIYYDQKAKGGGYVKFADPLGGYSSKTMTYTKFLDGMRDAGTSGRYSFWVMR